MNKAIIITRNEYSAYPDFKKAIDERESCPYNTRSILLNKFLIERNLWIEEKQELEKQNTTISDGDVYRSIFKVPCDKSIDNKDVMRYGIKQKMDVSKSERIEKPYASFISGEWEVILVLYDIVGIGQRECVEPVDLFLDSICQDLGITEPEGDHVLYVHDKQVGLIGDGILVENHELRETIGKNRVFQWAQKHTSIFKRIAYFVHETKDTNFFKVNILTKDFFGENIVTNYRRLNSLTEDDF